MGRGGVQLDDTTLLIEPGKAKEIAAQIASEAAKKGEAMVDPADLVSGNHQAGHHGHDRRRRKALQAHDDRNVFQATGR